LKYVKPEGLSDIRVSSYLSEGDDVTVKIHMDRLITWNLLTQRLARHCVQVVGSIHSMMSLKVDEQFILRKKENKQIETLTESSEIMILYPIL
jgi:hypothetical protein